MHTHLKTELNIFIFCRFMAIFVCFSEYSLFVRKCQKVSQFLEWDGKFLSIWSLIDTMRYLGLNCNICSFYGPKSVIYLRGQFRPPKPKHWGDSIS